jgi:hypothetical protein
MKVGQTRIVSCRQAYGVVEAGGESRVANIFQDTDEKSLTHDNTLA